MVRVGILCCYSHSAHSLCFKIIRIVVLKCYLFIYFIFREGERQGEKHQCQRETLINQLLFPTCPDQGPNSQPRHVHSSEIELATNQLNHTSQDLFLPFYVLFFGIQLLSFSPYSREKERLNFTSLG